MEIIINYLLIGTILAFVFRLIVNYMTQESINIGEQLWIIILWPAMLVVFFYQLIKEIFK
tara:strand:- start:1628 stop:1807 length:180 start_codon:yes stop_codon:yes gene_type:complete